jgi:dihydroorotase
MYDLLIKGGTAIDPARGLNAALDVAVTAGRVAKLDTSIPVSEAKEVIDASNKIVAPGLIDLHAHVFRQDHVVDADELCGVRAGVTSIIDAGSAGAPDFSNFLHSAMPQPDL